MSTLFWRKFFKLPQTYLLLLGAVLGYSCFLLILRPRPLTLLGGGLITLTAMGTWVVEVKKELTWLQDNLLDREVFQLRLKAIEQKVQNRASPHWHQAKTWVLEIQQFASRIGEREPGLLPELLETLYTTLTLSEQLVDKLLATAQVKSDAYREIAQQQLQTSYDRLQVTHDQLQGLHDQVVLLSGDHSLAFAPAEIPVQLRSVIEANRIALRQKQG